MLILINLFIYQLNRDRILGTYIQRMFGIFLSMKNVAVAAVHGLDKACVQPHVHAYSTHSHCAVI